MADYKQTLARPPNVPRSVLIVIDQFEEILTVDPLAREAKEEFFTQLGELLADTSVWALFALREDYLAQLDPYARLIPTHLRSRYRLDLLRRDMAEQAITGPAAPRTWSETALKKVLDDLGSEGLYYEPMQLQVVCRGLWEQMPDSATSVELRDVTTFGDVTRALSKYYADTMQRIARGDLRRERKLRGWIGEQLISPNRIRTQVLRGAKKTLELANEQIEQIVDAHLIRADQRGDAVWYELAHDRLIRPVRADNDRWAQEHLHPVQLQAELWARRGKPSALLLSGKALRAAEAWEKQQARTVDPESEFLAASRAARVARGTAARPWWVVGILAVLVLVGGGWSYRKQVKAEEKRLHDAAVADAATVKAGEEKARAEKEALARRDQERLVAILEATDDPTIQVALLREVEDPVNLRRWMQLATTARQTPIARAVLPQDSGEAAKPGISPDGRYLLAVDTGEIHLWLAEQRRRVRLSEPANQATHSIYAFSPDSSLVAVSRNVRLDVWRTDGTSRPIWTTKQKTTISTVAFPLTENASY
ncbi:hypothetical protein [Nannocystis sp.]|uniref:nSTAND1 domain-containing NTPase n=1 Tax=Nannocystis sp. TaxID=1962667 RepID=UPI0025F6B26A|nr:hypothetical protein [Nannocystis sp.]MBK7828407.1 hypothetical protein [Nannocystis sp.]